MNVPDFNLRPTVFSENEQAFLKEVVAKLSKGCVNCKSCDWCIFTNFCRQVSLNGDTTSPSELLANILTVLGIDVD